MSHHACALEHLHSSCTDVLINGLIVRKLCDLEE